MPNTETGEVLEKHDVPNTETGGVLENMMCLILRLVASWKT